MLVNRTMGGGINAGQSFFLPLGDSGSGAVNTTPASAAGDGTPTFTRATTATTISSAGLVLPVSSGVARAYYDPTTLSYLGYLAEGARTNLCLQSESADNASWTKTDTTVTANSIVSPDGATTADLLTEGVAGTGAIAQTVTGTADVTQTESWHLKYGNTQWVFARIFNGANEVRGWFDLLNGAVGSVSNIGTGTGAAVTVKALPNGWYRFTLSGNVGSAATALNMQMSSASADASTTRVNNATRYQWGTQFESNASFASTYIPTTTASVTRNADVLTYASAGNVSDTAGTSYAEFLMLGNLNSNQAVLSRDGNGRFPYMNTSINVATMYDGTTSFVSNASTTALNNVVKNASSWGGNGQRDSYNGTAVASAAFDGTMGSGALAIGCFNTGTAQLFGTIRNVRIWTRQLTDAQLQGLTA